VLSSAVPTVWTWLEPHACEAAITPDCSECATRLLLWWHHKLLSKSSFQISQGFQCPLSIMTTFPTHIPTLAWVTSYVFLFYCHAIRTEISVVWPVRNHICWRPQYVVLFLDPCHFHDLLASPGREVLHTFRSIISHSKVPFCLVAVTRDRVFCLLFVYQETSSLRCRCYSRANFCPQERLAQSVVVHALVCACLGRRCLPVPLLPWRYDRVSECTRGLVLSGTTTE
jgi:hypothetical protein